MRPVILAAALALLAACGQSPAEVRTEWQGRPEFIARDQVLAPASLSAFFDCLQANGGTIVAAHRGGVAPGFAENAIATFEHALAQAPVALEIDVRRAKDGVLVLMHDETLERTTTGAGPVYALTGAEIAALTLEDNEGARLEGQHPPTLREALDWAAGKTILELDVKQGVPIGEVVREVAAAGAQQRVIIITYNIGDAIAAHRADPSLMISTTVRTIDDIDRLARAGVDLSRILAWTGTNEPDAGLNVDLQQRGVESLFGTLGPPATSWDGRFARGEAQGYAEFAETGLELIASDRAVDAYHALGSANVAAQTCAAQ